MIYVAIVLVVGAVFVVLGRRMRSLLRRRPAPVTDGGRTRFVPSPKAALVALPVAAIAVFIGARNALPGGITIIVVAAISWVVWMLLFSGRVRTATPEFRAGLTHGLFLIFFISYTLGITLWLSVGLLAGVTGHSAGLHARLHRFGGAPDVVRVAADDVAPFSIEGSTRIREMTLRAGGVATIVFSNFPASPTNGCAAACGETEPNGIAVRHNISIYRTTGEAIFVGEITAPTAEAAGGILNPATTTYRFGSPAAGMYLYRCDVHPLAMHGSVHVLPAGAPVTHPSSNEGIRDIARRIAEVSHGAEDTTAIALDYTFSFVSLGLGVFLVLLRPRERMSRIFGIAMVGTAAAYNLQSHAALATVDTFDVLHSLFHPLTGVTYIFALVLFPDGRLIPRFANRYVRFVYRIAFGVAALVFLAVTGSILPDFNRHPAALVLTFGMAIPIIGIIAQSYRLRHSPSSEARQQSRLLLIALAASFGLGVLLLLALGIDLKALIRPNFVDRTVIGAADARAFRVFQPLFVVIPLALFAGILRFRLWDIDLVIRRTIVYGALAGCLGAVYVGVVVVLGGAVGGRTGLSIAATVLVAVAFDPLRTRLQRLANRIVYGERASPYEVMAGVAHRLEGMTTGEEMLPAIADVVARGVGADRARATLFLASGGSVLGSAPPDDDGARAYDRTITLSHQGEQVGELAVAKRPGDPLRAAENRLLEAVGSQVAIALHSLRLAERLRARLSDLKRTTAQLQASRRRIVNAQDAERNRLEHEIHERVESPLASISTTIARAERTLRRNQHGSIALLDEAAAAANEVQDRLRDLARGIFPPLLADKGLVPALESQARKSAVSVLVHTSSAERFDANAEAAVYFCCVEAIRSAALRSGGSPVIVELEMDHDWVSFEVRDDGHGLSDAALTGAELQAMVDRIEAVGGRLEVLANPEGTRLSGRVPAQPSAGDGDLIPPGR